MAEDVIHSVEIEVEGLYESAIHIGHAVCDGVRHVTIDTDPDGVLDVPAIDSPADIDRIIAALVEAKAFLEGGK